MRQEELIMVEMFKLDLVPIESVIVALSNTGTTIAEYFGSEFGSNDKVDAGLYVMDILERVKIDYNLIPDEVYKSSTCTLSYFSMREDALKIMEAVLNEEISLDDIDVVYEETERTVREYFGGGYSPNKEVRTGLYITNLSQDTERNYELSPNEKFWENVSGTTLSYFEL